jgi:hypothetical protein
MHAKSRVRGNICTDYYITGPIPFSLLFEKGKLMKIIYWIIIGLFVSLCSVLAIGQGKKEEKEGTSSTVQNMNNDEQMRKIEGTSSTVQDINIDELMRKRVEERLKQFHVKGGFVFVDNTIGDIAHSLNGMSRGFYGREWGVEFIVGSSGGGLNEKLPSAMEVYEDISLYEVLCRLEEKTDMEFIIEPEGVILCREWDK